MGIREILIGLWDKEKERGGRGGGYFHQLQTVGTGRRHIVERARERGDEIKT